MTLFPCRQLCAALLAMSLSAAVLAAERPRIGLVLGGGGARGLSHIGVLKVLEEARVPVDCVVGTSMGALVAGSYATGRSPAELEEKVKAAPWDELLKGVVARSTSSYQSKRESEMNMAIEVGLNNGKVQLPESAISTQGIEFFLRDLSRRVSANSFDDLPTPYRAIATDLVSGDMVVMKDGDLVSAMLGSMAVPGVFPPVERQGRLLVDGGLVRNVPVDIARDLCADVIIAVNVGTQPLKREELRNIFNIADQYTRLMMEQNVKPQLASLGERDVLISPELGELSSTDFDKSVQLIARGEVAARGALTQLSRYSLTPEDYARWQARRSERQVPVQAIQDVRISPQKWVNPAVVTSRIDVTPGAPLDVPALEGRLREIMGTGDFSQVNYQLEQGERGQRLTVQPVEKSWGPNYLGLGLNFATDFDRWTTGGVTAQYRRTWLNELGGEFRVLGQLGNNLNAHAEWFQPLFVDKTLFVAPYAGYRNIDEYAWLHDSNVATYQNVTRYAGVDIGSLVTDYGAELRVGPVMHTYSSKVTVGAPWLPSQHISDYGVQLQLYYDQLDDYFFPTHGAMLHLEGYQSMGGTEGYESYNRFGGSTRWAFGHGDTAGYVKLAGMVAGGNLPAAELASLGGFMNLSSYHVNQLVGEEMYYGGLNLYHSTPYGYLGLMLEGGQVGGVPSTADFYGDSLRWSAMLYWGAKSFLGPVYVGFAYGDNGRGKLYFNLGQPY
ncbi:patatin-like phospholipase family protein [Chitinilyticum piscinae]|uniref:Patatin-like phospholipase family protein n=1 Tax=Chitinilyticum piscinae TaxID=2866724 RepID=A0A8J7K1H1_9NEIS|nr:patatin-like phospholipase family protein [Chitinilyticum piscinae]MBE9609191.1 patatin-like phospholipase family protein [Chitinilyticum piscinae]